MTDLICNECGRTFDDGDEDVTLGGPCPEGAKDEPYTPVLDRAYTEKGCPGGTLRPAERGGPCTGPRDSRHAPRRGRDEDLPGEMQARMSVPE